MTEQSAGGKSEDKSSRPSSEPLTSVAGSLAAVFIRKSLEKGHKTEILTLQTKDEKDDRRE